jgi:hypothetical protein
MDKAPSKTFQDLIVWQKAHQLGSADAARPLSDAVQRANEPRAEVRELHRRVGNIGLICRFVRASLPNAARISNRSSISQQADDLPHRAQQIESVDAIDNAVGAAFAKDQNHERAGARFH